MQQASELLEIAKIGTVHGGSALYGISYAAIRSVASGGKVCLVALDASGAATLFNDDRIEAAFAYVVPPSLADMERRLRARLKEAPSTIERRVEWARAEVCCPTPIRSNLFPMKVRLTLSARVFSPKLSMFCPE